METQYIRTIRKAGNSKVVTIPPSFSDLQVGDQVWVEQSGNKVLLTKVER